MREAEEEEWNSEDAAASIVQQANARLAANDAMLYIFLYGPSASPILHPSVRPSVGLFVQLRLLRGDKNDLATCTFGHGRLLHAASEAQLKL